ncbi:MAG: N-acetyltransferase [Planctomycetota bacterium]|nr:MAG: N-acetyltransferase [Planctomycetota bacterium]
MLASIEPDTFRYMMSCRAALTHDAVHADAARLNPLPNHMAFGVIDRRTGEVADSTVSMNIGAEHHGLEIGCTWIATRWRGSGPSTSMEHPMLTHAFDTLGVIRVEPRTDARNSASRRAIEKRDAEQQGLFRSHMLLPDGNLRDSVVHAIMRDHLQEVRERLGPATAE